MLRQGRGGVGTQAGEQARAEMRLKHPTVILNAEQQRDR